MKMFMLRFAMLFALLCAGHGQTIPPNTTSLSETPSPSTLPSTVSSLNEKQRLDCLTCMRIRAKCPTSCAKPLKCIPKGKACEGPSKPASTSNTCCSPLRCVKSKSSGSIDKQCESVRITPQRGINPADIAKGGNAQPGAANNQNFCSGCLRGTICPIGCSKQCLPKWWVCAGPKKSRNHSNTCCNGWQCVQSKNRKVRSKRCEPKPPKCVPKWGWRCSRSVRCCNSGWRCVRVTVNGFTGNRCEPPRIQSTCVPKWFHCGGPKRCCGGWRCVRPRNAPNFKGKRCEPK